MEKTSLIGVALLLSLLAFAGCSSSGSKASALPPVGTPGEGGLVQNVPPVSQAQTSPMGLGKFTSGVKSLLSTKQADKAPVEDDPLALSKRPQEGPDLYVVLAQLHERSGNLNGAAEQYQRALAADPSHLGALLGFARLNDREGRFAQAEQLYQQATARHPQSAAAHNDLGLCLARQGKLPAAQQALGKAIELAPDRKLYRNNLALVLVEMGRPAEALRQLAAVDPPAVAHYNLGYLLSERNQIEAARFQFAKAAELDPTFAEAQHWLAMLPPPSGAEAGAPSAAYPSTDSPAPRYADERPIGREGRAGDDTMLR